MGKPTSMGWDRLGKMFTMLVDAARKREEIEED